MFSHARPGTADASAVPDDVDRDSETMNPLIEGAADRPTFDEQVNECGVPSRRARPAWTSARAGASLWQERQVLDEDGRAHGEWCARHILEGSREQHRRAPRPSSVSASTSGRVPGGAPVNHVTDLRQSQ